MKQRLKELGFTEKIIQESLRYDNLFLGRVVAQYKNLNKVATANSELTAEISGKYRFAAQKPSDYPAVGDFVMGVTIFFGEIFNANKMTGGLV